jgi:hypothetical protein
MIERGRIEIREPADWDWDGAPPWTTAEVNTVLADPRTWRWSEDGDGRKVTCACHAQMSRLSWDFSCRSWPGR